MTSKDEQIRAAIAEEAADWLVANDEELLSEGECAALATWLKASPVHVEEFLGVSVVARDLRKAAADPQYSIDTVVAGARAADQTRVRRLWSRLSTPLSDGWLTAAAATTAALMVASLGLFSLRNVRPVGSVLEPTSTAALHFETRHGEQFTRRLADSSVLHLNTDSAVTIRFSRAERLVMLTSGQAVFEVAHEPKRAFRVLAGSAEVIATGTKFDVRLKDNSTLVTVVEGGVAVGQLPVSQSGGKNANYERRYVQVGSNHQIRVAAGDWPVTPTSVDAQRTTSWLRHEIVFDHEPLERVAAEFDRYAPKPFEIATPALGKLEISGVFATNDTDAFIAFLRSLKGVRVEVTATHIRVLQQ